MSPKIIGDGMLEAVRRNEMYIFTHPDRRAALVTRMEGILDVYPKPE